MRKSRAIAAAIIATPALAAGLCTAPDSAADTAFHLPERTAVLLDRYCYSCHDEDIDMAEDLSSGYSGFVLSFF